MKHLMIDLETLGIDTDCVITQIGAVQFDPRAGKLGAEFLSHVAAEGQIGRRISGNTVTWWLKQSSEARLEFVSGQERARSLTVVLADFQRWVAEAFLLNFAGMLDGVWSHGATFDVAILTDAFRQTRGDPPWHYGAVRDTRTLFDVAGLDFKTFPRNGTHHNALDDARTQALAVIEAYKRLGRVA